MYYLYAEDTKTGDHHPIIALRSTRFSRAMRQAEKEPKDRGHARYFIARPTALDNPAPDMLTAAYLGVRTKPAPAGSPENQAHQRTTLRRQASARSGAHRDVEWEG